MNRIQKISFSILAAILFSTAAFAATIHGVVKDPSGAAVAGAAIELQSPSGAHLAAKSDAAGAFEIANVPPGALRLRVERSGFDVYETNITASDAGSPNLDVRLTVAAIRQQVQVSGARGPNADPVYRSLREAPLAASLVVENLVLRRDNGVLTLKSGAIGFAAPVMGRATMAVFSGEGTFTFEPASLGEQEHMKRLTNLDRVDETFDRALFCFTDRTAEDIRSQAKTPAQDARLAEILSEFRKRLRDRPEPIHSMSEALVYSDDMDNMDAEILADLYNPSQAGFFTAYLHGRKHPDLRFMVKPRGAFPTLPMTSPEEVAIVNLDTNSDQDGLWYLGHFKSEIDAHTATSDEDKRVVQAEKFRVETAIGRNDRMTAVATVTFRAVTNGDRLIKFGLLPSLRVSRVSLGGQDITYVQEDRRADGTFYVVMPQPMKRGSVYQVTIEYAGDRVINKAGGGNFAVGARDSWYPNVNAFRDHARYDLTFKVPKQYMLVSVGKLVKEWTEQDFACTQWVSEVPVAVAGFNYGTFKKRQITDPKLNFEIEGYATSEVPDYLRAVEIGDPNGGPKGGATGTLSPSRLIDQSLVETQNAIRIFNLWFGKPEYGRIAITQQPQFNFGQSWPTLVYLPLVSYLDSTQRWQLLSGMQTRMTEFVDEVTSHEVSHQWWGHEVGWTTYHDQWLSEGFAFFSAGLYLQLTEKSPEKYLNYWLEAKKTLTEKNSFGKRAGDAGSLWMGLRLINPKNPGAYNNLVYRKGGYVLNMIRALMYDAKEGDRPFIEMMHDYVTTHLHGNASTEDFQRIVEKHIQPIMNVTGDGKMDWFFKQWVYGSAIPRYKFDYTGAADADGKWLVKASLTQSEVPEDFSGLVPLYAEIDGKNVRLGLVGIRGNTTVNNMQLKLPKKPKKVAINIYHEILEQ